MSQSKKLTAKQQRFVDEYLIDGDAKRSAIAAGYSAKTAEQKGCNLKKEPHIAAAIKAGQAEISERNKLTVDDLLAELEEARAIAQIEGKGSAMVAATMGKAKLLGLLVDKSETKTEGSISINIGFE